MRLSRKADASLSSVTSEKGAMRQIASEMRGSLAQIVVVGDSLSACCPFARLSWRPFGVLNLARGGAKLEDIAKQLRAASQMHPAWFLIDGGLNDLLGGGASPVTLSRDFRLLLEELPECARAIFTLMPHVADRRETDRIDDANAAFAELCRERGVAVLDLNPSLSFEGARRPEMTYDGLHFTPRANALWIAALKAMLRRAPWGTNRS